jgi:hypothetical protein
MLTITVRQSENLATWGEPKTAFTLPDEVEDTGETLRWRSSSQDKAVTETEPSEKQDSWVFAFSFDTQKPTLDSSN